MKKIVALILALAMVFTFAACGGSTTETATTTTAATTNSTAATTTTTEAAEATGLDALDPITIDFATPNADANIESEYAAKWVAAV